MSNRKDISGQKFGRLTVLEFDSYKNKKSYYRCECDCGNIKTVVRCSLTSGKTQSCGCMKKEIASITGKKNAKHKMTNRRIWRIWAGMRERCNNTNSPAYMSYGGRGIKVCNKWNMDFIAFRDWAYEYGYNEKLTLDRIDVNGDYTPTNCRWATYKEQENNRRNNRKINICGCEKTVSEWAEAVGINAATLLFRINSNWPQKDLFIPPNLNNKNIRRKTYEQL